ncbi:MAG: archaeosortase/exosortase family protein [Candidatus Aenigmarchaeota archaeon]|nr:archaeosortase/exosortase family protein [Candidatus Aenigmarchaeota archaeon]
MNNEKLKRTLIFLIKLTLLSLPLYAIIFFGVNFDFFQGFIVFHFVNFLNFIGIPSTQNGFSIILSSLAIVINKDCTGWKSLLFFIALIIATDIHWKRKTINIFLGSLAIFSINILRIFVMILIGLAYPSIFSFLHDLLWQFSMIFTVIILWLMLWKFSKNLLE